MLPKHVLNIPCIETACLQLEWIIELVNIFFNIIWDLKLSFLSDLLTYLVNLLFKNSQKNNCIDITYMYMTVAPLALEWIIGLVTSLLLPRQNGCLCLHLIHVFHDICIFFYNSHTLTCPSVITNIKIFKCCQTSC